MCPQSSVFADPPEPGAGLLLRSTRDPPGDGAARISLAGELSLATADQARDAIKFTQHEVPVVICDLGEVTFIDISGMCVLVDLAARAHHRGGLLTVVNPPAIVGPFLRVFGLDHGPAIGGDAHTPERAAACNAAMRPRRDRPAPAHHAARRARH